MTLHAKTQSRSPNFSWQNFKFCGSYPQLSLTIFDICSMLTFEIYVIFGCIGELSFENDRRPVNLNERENSVQLYRKFL